MFVIRRRTVLIFSVLLITALTFVFCFSVLSDTTVGNADINSIRIVLDAGHGGVDNGAIGVKTKAKESELNLKVVKKVEKLLSDAGIEVVLTRSTDAGLYGIATKNLKRKDMEKRKEIILKSNPVLVVSVHMNKYSLSSRRGAQVFYKGTDELGKLLAESVQSEFNSLPTATRSCSPIQGDYYILNCSDFPSIIVECGFLSNPDDESLLITDEYQDTVAYTVFKGIVRYLTETSFNYIER